MGRLFRCLFLFMAVLILGAVSSALFADVIEGQVVLVQDWNLYIRTQSNVPLSLTPTWVKEGTAWQPSRPARTILPALESGEYVRINWTMDTVEGRRRINSIQVISAFEGTLKGVVASASISQLVVKPKEEPGAVTLNPRMVQVNGKWVTDPAVADKLRNLPANTKVTVRWSWDQEGRKRITSITIGW